MRSRSLTRSLRRSEPSAASPSVVTHLVIGGTKGTLREGPHALVVPEESLDHAILEGVIGDDDDAAAGSEETHRLRQGGSELLELPVGRDAERLEGTTRRMRASGAPSHGARNHASQLVRRRDRRS